MGSIVIENSIARQYLTIHTIMMQQVLVSLHMPKI